MSAQPVYLKPVPDWDDHEKPTLPGSPSMPWHPPWIRIAYACIALLVGITGGLGNALVTANLPVIQGQMGLTPAQAAWLPAAFVMVNVTANLLVFKVRQQYGIRLFAEIGLGVYAALTVLHLFAGGFESMVLLRAASGLAGAACSTLAVLYTLQALPRAYTGKLLVVGVGISQLAIPLAWILSPGLVGDGTWHTLYLFEAGLALCSFAAVVVLKLPPGVHIRVLERTDFLTFALMATAVALIVAVLAQGYVRWWFDTPWLAWLLVAAIVLMTLSFAIEHNRKNPLIQTRWLFSGPAIRFIIGAFLIRFLTTEQSFGMVNMLRTLGMAPEQMQPLFVVILIGTIAGIAASALTFGPKTMIPQILLAIVLIGSAGWLDRHRTSLDRPADFFLSQFLLSMGAGMFMGPLILIGIQQALKQGIDHVVSFIVTLSMTQVMAGLAGSAVLGTYQLHQERVHSAALTAQLDPSHAAVAQRLRLQQQIYTGVVADPVLRSAQGTAQLAQVVRREANVRAYNDLFTLSGRIAVGFLLWSLLLTIRTTLRNRKASAPATTAPAVAAATIESS